MKTIPEIIAELKDRFGLDYSASIFRADRRASYGIAEPVYRSCPQRFADDTAERIARRLGAVAEYRAAVASVTGKPAPSVRQLVSMKALRQVKGKGRR